MSEQDASDPSGAPSPEPVSRGEAAWTTGQGIGFLVALPGWIAIGLAVAVFVVSLTATDISEIGEYSLFVVGVTLGAGGLGLAIPGGIVFNRCKRR